MRTGRSDPWLSELFSSVFWSIYRAFVVKEMPRGGVDVFGCTRQVRDRLSGFKELNSNLIALRSGWVSKKVHRLLPTAEAGRLQRLDIF